MGSMTLLGAGKPPAAAGGPAYTGPGDVAGWSGAYGYTGLRAYNASKIGTSCIDICSNGGGAASNLQTINSASNGFIDTAAIATWQGLHGSSVYVDKVYDQAGSQPLTFVGTRPLLISSVFGGLPGMFFDEAGTGGNWMSSASNATVQAQPVTVAAIVKITGTGEVVTDGSFDFQPLAVVGANVRSQQAGGSRIDYTGTDNSPESIISVLNGASSSMSIQGTIASNGNPGAGGIGTVTSAKLTMGAIEGGGVLMDGYIFEILVKAGAVSTTNQGLLTTNQRAIGTGF